LRHDQALPPEALKTAHALVELRKQRVPIQYALKQTWFMGLPFVMEAGVFIPRSDTETLVQAVITIVQSKKQQSVTLAEIGIGSGAISVSLLKALPQCKIFASDISDKAAALADKNARDHKVSDRLEIKCAHWRPVLPQNLDGIVSNPPYIPLNLSSTLAPEVLDHEPHQALFGSGDDGLDFYRELASVAPDHLARGGFLAVEVGDGQSDEVCRILGEREWIQISTLLDMNGWARVVTAWKQ
jgi:release factor glutamine methyltransferase